MRTLSRKNQHVPIAYLAILVALRAVGGRPGIPPWAGGAARPRGKVLPSVVVRLSTPALHNALLRPDSPHETVWLPFNSTPMRPALLLAAVRTTGSAPNDSADACAVSFAWERNTNAPDRRPLAVAWEGPSEPRLVATMGQCDLPIRPDGVNPPGGGAAHPP